jgi:hypothetical protein
VTAPSQKRPANECALDWAGCVGNHAQTSLSRTRSTSRRLAHRIAVTRSKGDDMGQLARPRSLLTWSRLADARMARVAHPSQRLTARTIAVEIMAKLQAEASRPECANAAVVLLSSRCAARGSLSI